jgi:hypothetical protein
MGKIRIPYRISMTYVPLTTYRRLTVGIEENKTPFELALEEAVIGCLGIGVHPSEMIVAMERKVADLKDMLAKLPC